MADLTGILTGAVENVFNLFPCEIILPYEQGIKFSWGKDVELLRHNNGMRKLPFFKLKKDRWYLPFQLTERTGVHWYAPFVGNIESTSTARAPLECDIQDLMTKGKTDEDEEGEELYQRGDPVTIQLSLSYEIINIRKYWIKLREHEEFLENEARAAVSRQVRRYTSGELNNAISMNGHSSYSGKESTQRELFDGLEGVVSEDGEERAETEEEIKREYSQFELDIMDEMNRKVRRYGIRIREVGVPVYTQTRSIRLIGGGSGSYVDEDEEV